MTHTKTGLLSGLALCGALIALAPAPSMGQPPKGKGPNADVRADQAVFHYLLEKHKSIRRTVKHLENGVETLTESDVPEVAAKIQEHVAAMHKRVKEGRGLRFWDDLFVAIFKDHAKITMAVENTAKGVKVKETSDDLRAVKLIQAHAEVVSLFVKLGFEEARKNHPVPPETPDAAKLAFPVIAGYGGVVSLPKAADPPRKGAKVVFDITADAKPDDVNKGLERVARLLNLYGAAGLKASDVKITLVLHGEATKSALTDAAYKKSFGAAKNPNLPLVHALRWAGVEVFVCGQALHYKKFAAADVADDLTITQAALTVVLNRQADGFACVPVP